MHTKPQKFTLLALAVLAVMAVVMTDVQAEDEPPSTSAKRCCVRYHSADILQASVPVETGKVNCKAHPGSCK